MPDLNRANRQCADLDIRGYADKKLLFNADFCNTTTAGFSSDNTYSMKKGSKGIGFHNPLEGTMTIEFQEHPFKVYSLLSDGTIDSTAVLPSSTVVTATTADKLVVPSGAVGLTVFAADDFGGTEIVGTASGTSWTPTTTGAITSASSYKISYLTTVSSGIKRIQFNNKKLPKDYYITQKTLDKNENGDYVGFDMIAYKAVIKRKIDVSFSSTGDPASIKMEFDCLEDANGNVMDMVEDTTAN